MTPINPLPSFTDPDLQTLLQTSKNFGWIIGALMSVYFANRGCRYGIIISNIIIIIGNSMILFYHSFYCVLSGTIVQGIGVGLLIVYSLRYINESSPCEVNGPSGGMFQVFVTLGLLFNSLLNKFIDDKDCLRKYTIIWIVPIPMCILQIVLFIFVFKFDTPKIINKNGDSTKLRQVFSHLYKENVV